MDLLRAILGEKKISYGGYSYGTYLGAVYTQLFPGRADRFVLDSAVDPARAWRGMIEWWAEGAEPAFDRWTEWAAERSEKYSLGDTPKEVERTFWDLVAQADEMAIEVVGQPTTGDGIGMREAVFSPKYATERVVELKKAAAGEPASAKKVAAYAGSEGTGTGGAAAEVPSNLLMASFWGVACNKVGSLVVQKFSGPSTILATAVGRPDLTSARAVVRWVWVIGSTRCTRTSISPPQVRPTAKASSSE